MKNVSFLLVSVTIVCSNSIFILLSTFDSGSRYGRRSNWFKIHCLIQDQVEMSSRMGEQNAAAASQSLLSLSNGALSQLSSSGSTDASPNAKDLINQYKNGLKELQDTAAKVSPTSTSSYTSLLEAAAKSGLKLPGNGKCASPLTTTNAGNGSVASKSSTAKLNKSLSQLPLSPVSPLSPFFQNQLLARNLVNAANASSNNSSSSHAANAAAVAAAAQSKLNPLGLYPNPLYNYQAAAAAAAAAQFLPLQPLLQNGAGLMNAANFGLGAAVNMSNPLANGLPNMSSNSLANGANNRASTSPPLSGSGPNSSASTPNSNHGIAANNAVSMLQQQQQQTALLQQQFLGNALRSAAAAASAAATGNAGAKPTSGARQADGSELYGDVPEQERPIDLSVKQSPFEALAFSQLCANYGGLFGGLAGFPGFPNPIMPGATGALDGLLGANDCTFSPSSSNEENFANLQQLAASGNLPTDLNSKAALLNSLQLASGLGSLSNAFGREAADAGSEAEDETLQSSMNLPSGSETARSDGAGDESNCSESPAESSLKPPSKRIKTESNLSQTLNSAKNFLAMAQLGALANPQLQLFANAGLLGNLGSPTGKLIGNGPTMNAQIELLKRLSELQQGSRSVGETTTASDADEICSGKRKKANGLIGDKAKDKNNNEQDDRRAENVRRKSGSSEQTESNSDEANNDCDLGRKEAVPGRGTKRTACDDEPRKLTSKDNDDDDDDDCDTKESLQRLKKLRRKRRKVTNGESSQTDGDEADDEPEDDDNCMSIEKNLRLSGFTSGEAKSEVRPEEIAVTAFAVQEAH